MMAEIAKLPAERAERIMKMIREEEKKLEQAKIPAEPPKIEAQAKKEVKAKPRKKSIKEKIFDQITSGDSNVRETKETRITENITKDPMRILSGFTSFISGGKKQSKPKGVVDSEKKIENSKKRSVSTQDGADESALKIAQSMISDFGDEV